MMTEVSKVRSCESCKNVDCKESGLAYCVDSDTGQNSYAWFED